MPPISAAARSSAPAAASSSPPTLRQGARSPHVAQLQARLNSLGFSVGSADGVFGPRTTAAVKAFQRARGLTADGVVGPATWSKLGIGDRRVAPPTTQGGSGPTLKLGARGEPVRQLQLRLHAMGFPNLAVDGSFGPGTLAAVKSFQRARGLTADGVVGPATWSKLGIHVKGAPTSTPPSTGTGGNPFHADFVRAAQKVGVPTSWASSPSLVKLVQHESGWKPSAKNPRSTAFGLFQFLSSTWKNHLPEVPYGSTSPHWQAVGGFRYIKATYGNPDRAWAFWQATVKKNPALAPADLQAKARFWIARNFAGY
jgi:peptidoglycan hydrolase-like protein with peptidoglycan-binding domain